MVAFIESAGRKVTTAMKLTRTEAEDFIYRESYLLDNQAYTEWLKLFTEDGIYWLPMYDEVNPKLNTSILYDDSRLREMRVHQLVNKPHYAQIPPSRTVHLVSNVAVTPTTRSDESVVRCAVMVAELRAGDHRQLGLGNQRIFAGHCEYHLRDCGDLRIALKKVTLIQRDVPIENLSFLL
jgi:3-phenylpropionate/cinnamic acid dioxygenase small subunit